MQNSKSTVEERGSGIGKEYRDWGAGLTQVHTRLNLLT
jgi:hypothetical protein